MLPRRRPRGSLHDGISLNFATGRYFTKAQGGPANIQPLTSLFTFTGGNQSMYMGPAGLLVQSVTNTPRVEYDASGNCLGLLMEAARTNLCLQAQDLATTWVNTASTDTANATTAPDGTSTADKLVEDGTTGVHYISQSFAKATSNLTYVFSVWVKAAERGFVRLRIMDVAGGSNGVRADIDLTAGTITSQTGLGAGFTVGTSAISSYGNGWYRASISCTSSTAATLALDVFLSNALGTVSYSGDGASGMYVWGAQLEQAAFASSYIPTTTGSVARTADSCIRTLGSEFSATAGTVVVAGRASGGQAVGIEQCVWSLWTDVNNRYTYVRPSASDVARLTINNGGVNQATLDATFTSSASFKAASAWVANDFATTINGTAVLTDGAGTLPAVAVLGLGELGDTSSTMNGHIRRFDYYPTRLPNTYLVSAST